MQKNIHIQGKITTAILGDVDYFVNKQASKQASKQYIK